MIFWKQEARTANLLVTTSQAPKIYQYQDLSFLQDFAAFSLKHFLAFVNN